MLRNQRRHINKKRSERKELIRIIFDVLQIIILEISRRYFMKKFNSGETAPKSGSYKVVDSKGKVVNTVNMQKGDTLPPTQGKDNHFEID